MLAAGFLSSRKPGVLVIGRRGQVESDGMQEWEAGAEERASAVTECP